MKNQIHANSFTKKIGRAIYMVNVHFNENSKENFSDKLLRLIQNDIANRAETRPNHEKIISQKCE
jgi:hypothetical protein